MGDSDGDDDSGGVGRDSGDKDGVDKGGEGDDETELGRF